MSYTPHKNTILGTLVGRCAVVAAGKYCSVREPKNRAHFIAEAALCAEALTRSLRRARRDDSMEYLGRALVDTGGPSWSEAFDDYMELDRRDKNYICNRLVSLSTAVATELMEEAKRDNWLEVIAEVSDPIAWVLGDHESTPTARIDLLIRREDLEGDTWAKGVPPASSRLFLDLKLSKFMNQKMAEQLAVSVHKKYGIPFLLRTRKGIHNKVLGYHPDGDRLIWSSEYVAQASELTGDKADIWRRKYGRLPRRQQRPA